MQFAAPLARCIRSTTLLLAAPLGTGQAVAQEAGVASEQGYLAPKGQQQDYEPMDALKGKDYGKQRFK